MNVYTLGALTINSTTIPVSSVDPDWGVQVIHDSNSGIADAKFAGAIAMAGTIPFTTTALATALGLCGYDGLRVTDAIVYFPKVAHAGQRESSGHEKRTINEALLVPTSLTASHGGVAMLNYAMHLVTDGTNAPMIAATSASFPTTISGVTERFTLGPLYLGSTAYEVQSLTIDFGMDILRKSHSGQYYDILAGIMKRRTVVKWTTNDLSTVRSLSSLTGANMTQYLQKLSTTGGGLIAAGTASHIKLVATEGLNVFETESAAHDSDASVPFSTYLTYDGVNSPLQINTASAITTP